MNANLLKSELLKNDMTMQDLADELDLSYWSLTSKVRGDYEFKQGEIQKIAKILKLNSTEINEIFFSENI